jgi:predicted ABC-type exoprotein transport system permease subunit
MSRNCNLSEDILIILDTVFLLSKRKEIDELLVKKIPYELVMVLVPGLSGLPLPLLLPLLSLFCVKHGREDDLRK